MKSGFADPVQQVDRTRVLWRGRKLVYFGGCDYLRLSSHPRVLRAAGKAIEEIGLNVAASRKTTGNHPIYERLESATRKFFKAEAAILTSNAYLANLVAAQGLRGQITRAYIDSRAHASLRDAANFLGCPFEEFEHRNPNDLHKKLVSRKGKIAVLTDGMFAHDGSIAPLAELRAIAGPSALLWVDDAHSAGILGRNGRGAVELARIGRRNLLQTVTYSKAFGSYGGVILCERAIAKRIVDQSHILAGNTPLPLPMAAAALESLGVLANKNGLRERLWRNVDRFWARAKGSPPQPGSPIIACQPHEPGTLQEDLLQAGIHPPFIRYPGGPSEGYFRFALSSAHTIPQIDALARVLAGPLRQQQAADD